MNAIMMAATHNLPQALRHLLPYIDNINMKGPNGNTPLMFAAAKGNKECVISLLKAGADASIKNTNGLTAYDLAKKNNHKEISRIISLKNPAVYISMNNKVQKRIQ